jgi:hypothetical protein
MADVVPVPLDCTDGFNEAYYGRPEALLDPAARLSCSAWSSAGAAVRERFTRDLGRDLADGAWDARHGRLRSLPAFEGSRILVPRSPDHQFRGPAGYAVTRGQLSPSLLPAAPPDDIPFVPR